MWEGMWLDNPQISNHWTGQITPANPIGFASPLGVAFAGEQLQRVLGHTPQLSYIAPTAGPFSWPEQATYGGALNAGGIVNLYRALGQQGADAILQQDWANLQSEVPQSPVPQSTPGVTPRNQLGDVPRSQLGGALTAAPFETGLQLPAMLPGNVQLERVRQLLRQHGVQV